MSRHLLSLSVFISLIFPLRSQDVITLLNNQKKEVKVLEVRSDDIKCKSYDSLSNKTFYFDRREVFTIKFESGKIDTLNRLQEKKLSNPPFDESHPYRIVRFNNKFYSENKRLGYTETLKLVRFRAIETADVKLTQYFKTFKGHKRWLKGSVIAGSILTGVGGLTVVVGLINSIFYVVPSANSDMLQGGALMATGISVFCMASYNKKKTRKYFNLMIDAHNDTYK